MVPLFQKSYSAHLFLQERSVSMSSTLSSMMLSYRLLNIKLSQIWRDALHTLVISTALNKVALCVRSVGKGITSNRNWRAQIQGEQILTEGVNEPSTYMELITCLPSKIKYTTFLYRTSVSASNPSRERHCLCMEQSPSDWNDCEGPHLSNSGLA